MVYLESEKNLKKNYVRVNLRLSRLGLKPEWNLKNLKM